MYKVSSITLFTWLILVVHAGTYKDIFSNWVTKHVCLAKDSGQVLFSLKSDLDRFILTEPYYTVGVSGKYYVSRSGEEVCPARDTDCVINIPVPSSLLVFSTSSYHSFSPPRCVFKNGTSVTSNYAELSYTMVTWANQNKINLCKGQSTILAEGHIVDWSFPLPLSSSLKPSHLPYLCTCTMSSTNIKNDVNSNVNFSIITVDRDINASMFTSCESGFGIVDRDRDEEIYRNCNPRRLFMVEPVITTRATNMKVWLWVNSTSPIRVWAHFSSSQEMKITCSDELTSGVTLGPPVANTDQSTRTSISVSESTLPDEENFITQEVTSKATESTEYTTLTTPEELGSTEQALVSKSNTETFVPPTLNSPTPMASMEDSAWSTGKLLGVIIAIAVVSSILTLVFVILFKYSKKRKKANTRRPGDDFDNPVYEDITVPGFQTFIPPDIPPQRSVSVSDEPTNLTTRVSANNNSLAVGEDLHAVPPVVSDGANDNLKTNNTKTDDQTGNTSDGGTAGKGSEGLYYNVMEDGYQLPHSQDVVHEDMTESGYQVPHSQDVVHEDVTESGYQVPHSEDVVHEDVTESGYQVPHSEDVVHEDVTESGYQVPHSEDVVHEDVTESRYQVPHSEDVVHEDVTGSGYQVPHSEDVVYDDIARSEDTEEEGHYTDYMEDNPEYHYTDIEVNPHYEGLQDASMSALSAGNSSPYQTLATNDSGTYLELTTGPSDEPTQTTL